MAFFRNRSTASVSRCSVSKKSMVSPGRVADLHFTVSHLQPKLIAIDKQSDDDVMHLGRAGKADRLAHQAFDPGAQREVLALNLLRVALARLVRIRLEMTRVRAP